MPASASRPGGAPAAPAAPVAPATPAGPAPAAPPAGSQVFGGGRSNDTPIAMPMLGGMPMLMFAVELKSTQPIPIAEASTPHMPLLVQQAGAMMPATMTEGQRASPGPMGVHLFCVKPDT